MGLEVVTLPIADVERANTPLHSSCSSAFGQRRIEPEPGSASPAVRPWEKVCPYPSMAATAAKIASIAAAG